MSVLLLVAAACSGDDKTETDLTCTTSDSFCMCFEDNPGPDEACHADLWPSGFCCAVEEACHCREPACRKDSDTRCTCATTAFLGPDAWLTGGCVPPAGGRCCLEPGSLFGAFCTCSDEACPAGAAEVSFCTPEDIIDCGPAEPTAACN